MINKLYLWLAGVAGLIAAYFAVKKSGKKEAKAEQNKEVIKNVIDAKKVADSNVSLTDSAKRDKLRDKLRK